MTARSTRKSRLLMGLVLAAAAAAGPSHAEAPPDGSTGDAERRARIAMTVGTRRVTVGEIEERMASIPPFQLATFGATRDDVVRAYVDQVLVRDLVLAAGAEARRLDEQLPTKELLRRARSTATLRALRGAYPSAAAIPMDDVRKYYDDNRSRFDSPERINLWRILCKTQDEAERVLEAARKDPSIAKYNELAREHSIDKATNMRGGNLGFLGPDGTSNEAGVKVDAALVKATEGVKDGELVPKIVPEAGAYAVIWRRGTVPANRRSVEDASAQIRAALYRERTETAEKKLIDELRAKNVKEVNPGLLGIIELHPFDAGLSPPRALPSSLRTPSPSPSPPPARSP